MARKKQSKGSCSYCGKEMAKGGMTRHLATCSKRGEVIKEFQTKPDASELLYHLRVEDAWGGDFWLNLEMRGRATLEDLDNYLRAIWLECCGHMSRFSPGGWRSDDIDMDRRADQIFE